MLVAHDTSIIKEEELNRGSVGNLIKIVGCRRNLHGAGRKGPKKAQEPRAILVAATIEAFMLCPKSSSCFCSFSVSFLHFLLILHQILSGIDPHFVSSFFPFSFFCCCYFFNVKLLLRHGSVTRFLITGFSIFNIHLCVPICTCTNFASIFSLFLPIWAHEASFSGFN